MTRYRLGLLNCDPLNKAVRQQYGDYPMMFARLFATVEPEIEWVVYDATQGQLPQRYDDCDGYVITGSHFCVNDDELWIAPLTAFLQTLFVNQHKTIGICFGHQLMAKAIGGQVDRSPAGWGFGVSSATVITPQPWMKPKSSQYRVCISHQDQVLTLPDEAICIAETGHCPYAMIQASNCFLSMQGHPEFNTEYTRFLIEKRKALISDTCYQMSVNSLQQAPDTMLLAQWLVSFL